MTALVGADSETGAARTHRQGSGCRRPGRRAPTACRGSHRALFDLAREPASPVLRPRWPCSAAVGWCGSRVAARLRPGGPGETADVRGRTTMTTRNQLAGNEPDPDHGVSPFHFPHPTSRAARSVRSPILQPSAEIRQTCVRCKGLTPLFPIARSFGTGAGCDRASRREQGSTGSPRRAERAVARGGRGRQW